MPKRTRKYEAGKGSLSEEGHYFVMYMRLGAKWMVFIAIALSDVLERY